MELAIEINENSTMDIDEIIAEMDYEFNSSDAMISSEILEVIE